MASYLMVKSAKNDKILTFPQIEGYVFKPKYARQSCIQVNKVEIFSKVLIDRILTRKFDHSFKKVVALALKVIQDEDADESDTQIALDEAQLVREILLNRYQKFLAHEKEELFLKKVRLIENELRLKQVQIKQKAIYLENQEEKTHGRGR